MENNQSETVFYVPSMKEGVDFDIRWFTPVCEINLCGHATLAAAFVHFIQPVNTSGKIVFHSQSGLLTVTKNEDWIEMDFPSWKPGLCRITRSTEIAFWVLTRSFLFTGTATGWLNWNLKSGCRMPSRFLADEGAYR